jgi:hypothetical protein
MKTDRELMQMARTALELRCTDADGNEVDLVTPAIKALRDRLAQPEPDAVLAEREACAKVCLEEAQEAYHQEAFYLPQGNPGLLRIAEGAKRCADAIRARGEK